MAPKAPGPTPTPKIAQLITDAKAYLEGLGISTDGKKGHEVLAMAREQRNKPRAPKPR